MIYALSFYKLGFLLFLESTWDIRVRRNDMIQLNVEPSKKEAIAAETETTMEAKEEEEHS